jgi:hypothetical protein
MNTKAQLKKAAVMLCAAAVQADAAWQNILAAVKLAVQAKCYGAAGEGKTGEEMLKAQKTATTEWCKAALAKTPGTYDTVRVYISQAAAVALVPDAVGKIESGPKDKRSVVEVKAEGIKTRRDFSAVAQAANAKMGLGKVAGSGRTPAPSGDTPEQRKAAAEAAAAAEKVATEAAKAGTLAFHDMVREALSGKPEMAGRREALISALASCGFKLAPASLTEPKPEPKPERKGKPSRKGARQEARA